MRTAGIGLVLGGLAVLFACGGDDDGTGSGPNGSSSSSSSSGGSSSGAIADGGPTTPPAASCAAAGGGATVEKPTLLLELADDGGEGWLASPAVVDLDGDGQMEVVSARGTRVHAWKRDGARVFAFATGKDRIWASPAIGDFTGDGKLEIAIAARDSAFLIDAAGNALPGYPKTWGQEIRTLAAGDVDGDGKLDVVIGVRKTTGAVTDVVNAFTAGGAQVAGYPPVESGVAGCTPGPCYFAGLYDQNLAIGDLDGNAKQDLVLPHDNAYASFFEGSGAAFDANPMFAKRPKTPGVRYLHTLSQAQQGYADDENTENQAHFTNTAPAIADVDRDGKMDVVMLGSVQNTAQSDRLRGVSLWLLRPDASRLAGWETPFHAKDYVVGLADGFGKGLDDPPLTGASNLVGATNQVTVADIDGARPGLEMVFAGFDGRIHAVAADKTELWATPYAANGRALTGGVVVADLSGDGAPEIVFTTYSPDQDGGALFVLGGSGAVLHEVKLPKRGSMAVPTIADVDGNGTLEIVVSLKDAQPENKDVRVFTVPGSKTNCVLWSTGRANLLRNGWVR